MAEQRVEFANTLRGVASLSVLVAHYFGVFWIARDVSAGLAHVPVLPASFPSPVYVAWLQAAPVNFGPFGVALFFLISGFVIPFSLTRNTGPSFLLNRALRIYPVYAAGLAITVALLAAMDRRFGNPGLSLGVIASQIPGAHDLLGGPSVDGIIWTLEIEVRFYLLTTLMIGLFRSGSRAVLWVPLGLSAFVLFARFGPVGSPLTTGLIHVAAMSFQYMVFMFVGVALHYHYRGLIGPRLLAGAVGLYLALFVLTSGPPDTAVFARNYLPAAAVFLAAYAVRDRFPSSPALDFFARISYPLYVSHAVLGYVALHFLVAAGLPNYVSLSLAILLAVGVATGLHYAVEAPAQRLYRALTGWMALRHVQGPDAPPLPASAPAGR